MRLVFDHPRGTAPRRAAAPRPAQEDAPGGCPRIRVDDVAVAGDTLLSTTIEVGGHRWQGTTRIGDRALFVSTAYARIAGIRDRVADIRDGEERRREADRALRELGVQLLRCLFDRESRAFLWTHRWELEGLVLESSGALDLPWELVHLQSPDERTDDDAARFLASYGLVRWIDGAAHPTDLRIRPGRVRALCVDYAGDLRLPSVEHEADAVRRCFGAEPVRHVRRRDLVAALRSGFDLLHFAGHGQWSAASPPGEEVLLCDAHGGPPAAYTDGELRRSLRRIRRLGAAPAPVVVLNACDLGRVVSGPAQCAGFARTFLAWGAGAYVGCSWPVGDAPASGFAETFYDELVARHGTVRDAVLAARRAAAERGDASDLAYAVYAHPEARLASG